METADALSRPVDRRASAHGRPAPGASERDETPATAGRNVNDDDIAVEACDGLHLVGYGAVLDLRPVQWPEVPPGGVELPATDEIIDADGRSLGWATNTRAICPVVLIGCRNAVVEGLTVDGNADEIRKEAKLNFSTESNGVIVGGCTNVAVRNLRVHHIWTDGVSVRGKQASAISHVPLDPWVACQDVTIENCEVFAFGRGNVSVHESRGVRISDVRIHEGGITSTVPPGEDEDTMLGFLPQHGIDIEPDAAFSDLTGQPPGGVADRGNRFVTIENCQIYGNAGPAIDVGGRFSQVRVRGCLIDNERENSMPLILSSPHCSLLDSEINTRTGYIQLAVSGCWPGKNVFTMERCLGRSQRRPVSQPQPWLRHAVS